MAMVKEEISTDGCQEIGFSEGLETPWPFISKVSAVPQLLPFKVPQEDRTRKNISDPLVPSNAEILKSSNYNREDGSHFSLSAYPLQHDLPSLHRPLHTKMFPVSNHAISISMPNPVGNTFFSKNHYAATTGQNVAMSTINPQVLGGVPVISQLSTLPSLVSGSNAKVSGSSAQLTIFYAGSVNVYNGVSPEEAQAIMLLAGNGSPSSSTTLQPRAQVQVHSPMPAAVDATSVNRSIITPCSRMSSPISISSNTSSHLASVSFIKEEIVPDKTAIAAPAPVTNLEPRKHTNIIGPVSTSTLMPSVPQARKASLARFLEKRKERLMNVAPYNHSKQSSLESSKLYFSPFSAPGTTISFFGNQVK